MPNNTKRKIRDAEMRKERLHFKFITNYVRNLHGDVFIEAQELYEHVKRKNPRVRDLTKTKEFMSVVMPSAKIPRYYENRRLVCDAQVHRDMSRMVLNIPLVQLHSNAPLPPTVPSPPLPPTVPSQPLPPTVPSPPLPPTVPSPPLPPTVPSPPLPPTVPSPPLPPTVPSPPLPPTVPSPPLPPTVPSQPLPPTVPSPPLPPTVPSQPLPPTVPSPPLPFDTYQELLADLQKDPELYKILNDFPVLDYEDTTVADECMGDAFISSDLTPLEIELETFY